MEIVDITPYNDYEEMKVLEEIKKRPFIIERLEKTEERCITAVKTNGECLKYIPKTLQTEQICIEAVKQNGTAIKHISKKIINYEMCKIAVSNDGLALYNVPEQFKTKELCLIAISNKARSSRCVPKDVLTKEDYIELIDKNGLLLEAIEEHKRTKELCKRAILQNGMALYFVPENKKTEEICKLAFKTNSDAIIAIPEQYKTKEMCKIAIENNWKCLCYVPRNYLTKEMFIESFENYGKWAMKKFGYNQKYNMHISKILELLPDELKEDADIISIQRKNGIRWIKSKYFDGTSQKFIVEEFINEDIKSVDVSKSAPNKLYFNSYEELCDYVEESIDRFDLFESEFSKRIQGNNITTSDLQNYNFYEQNINICKSLQCAKCNEDTALNFIQNECIETALFKTQETVRKIFYISDIHLNHKLLKKFPEYATELDVAKFIEEYVEMLINSVKINEEDFLIIAGDISSTFQVSKIFYTTLAKKWNGGKIFAVLGNHELWNLDNKLSYEEIIAQYKELFAKLYIVFLHNNLYIFKDYESLIIDYEGIINADIRNLQKECEKSSFIIFGGVGFSAYNENFNASQGIYSETLNYQKDLEETQRFENAYIKLKNTLKNSELIILSHTPISDWTKEECVNNWIYVNGHTHKNKFIHNENSTIYADNQVGYSAQIAGLKYFTKLSYYDIFSQLGDGIYKISRDQYVEFYRGIESFYSMNFNRTDGTIFMLKKAGIYCFIFQNDKKLYVLNKGQSIAAEHKNLEYYYDAMEIYAQAINDLLEGYNSSLKVISNIVKKIGGEGRIHGSIIDIDFENHIYLNPYDGTVTPYYATSVVNKLVYKNIEMLLKKQKPELLENYIKLIKGTEQENAIVKGCSKMMDSFCDIDTEMYSPSLIINRLQYTTNFNIIRTWNDKIIDAAKKIVSRQKFID